MTELKVARPRFDSRRGQGYFLFATASSPALRPTQLLMYRLQGALCLELKRPGR